ncbi:MAG: helix-turn-helix transcriptional regulator [Pseudomonadota bacterium]
MAKLDQNLKNLAQRMVHAREGTGLTTAQLARRMGVKTTTLTNWEAGVSEPRANRLMTLAGILNVSLTWLVTGKGEGPLVHTVDTEMDYLRSSLLALKEQAETTAGQIDEIVKRLDEFRANGSRDES